MPRIRGMPVWRKSEWQRKTGQSCSQKLIAPVGYVFAEWGQYSNVWKHARRVGAMSLDGVKCILFFPNCTIMGGKEENWFFVLLYGWMAEFAQTSLKGPSRHVQNRRKGTCQTEPDLYIHPKLAFQGSRGRWAQGWNSSSFLTKTSLKLLEMKIRKIL